MLHHFGNRRLRLLSQRRILRLQRPSLRNLPAAVFLNHRRRAASQIPQPIRQIAVIPLHQSVITKIPILPKHRLAQQVIPQRIHS